MGVVNSTVAVERVSGIFIDSLHEYMYVVNLNKALLRLNETKVDYIVSNKPTGQAKVKLNQQTVADE